MVVVLSIVVKGENEKGGAGGAGLIKFAMGADASKSDMAGKPSENRASLVKAGSTMKVMMDTLMSAFLSGMLATALVALKHYAKNAMDNLTESMTGLGYADDP